MKLRWRRSPASVYPTYQAWRDGQIVADATMTGRHGVDDYPWDWYVIGPVPDGQRASGTCDTLRSAKAYVDAAEKAAGR